MLSGGVVLVVGGGYLALLFVIAFVTDRLASAGRARFLWSPAVYTLSLAVYCTSWTFYGAVGTAVRSGLEFITIYIGPTLVLMAWWLLLHKLVRVAKSQRVTSIADFLSARYGKSRTVSVVVTLVALASITPYIALQLLAVSRSYGALVGPSATQADTAFWTAALMAFFVILFGTRRLSADESQPGIVAAIAFESIVKLAALVAVSVFAVVVIRGSVGEGVDWRQALADVSGVPEDGGTRWIVLTLLSAAAIICLPRQFQVAVVENRREAHIGIAAWLFPLYLFVLTLSVLPIAVAGLTGLPEGAEPDLYVLTVPLEHGAEGLALVAFVGGLSAATSMVIVASLALAVMMSNHLVAPVLTQRALSGSAGLTPALLVSRRVAIIAIMVLGYLYVRAGGGGDGLASIGLIAFAGVAQFAPALIGGLFWRRATRYGATSGLVVGSLLWLVTLLMPSFGAGEGMVEVLRTVLLPEALAHGPGATDPLVFGALLSLVANTMVYVGVSLTTNGRAIDQLQATLFVDALDRGGPEPTLPRSADRRDLYRLTERILGPVRAHEIFASDEALADRDGPVDRVFIAHVEREIGFAVGSGSAHALVTRVVTGEPLTVEAAITLLGDSQEAMRAARALGVRSIELERTAAELRAANASLTALLEEKDDFLSRVSHEMRTPLTAVRSFAELLAEGPHDAARTDRFIGIIAAEADRLTRLLDDILDLARLEGGVAPMSMGRIDARDVLEASAAALEGLAEREGVSVTVEDGPPLYVNADADRLKQVLVNLISNAIKFHGEVPQVRVSGAVEGDRVVLRVIDEGHGISPAIRTRLFTKFGGSWGQEKRAGAGLGLAISRQIMARLDGELALERTGPDGSVFAAQLPKADRIALAS